MVILKSICLLTQEQEKLIEKKKSACSYRPRLIYDKKKIRIGIVFQTIYYFFAV